MRPTHGTATTHFNLVAASAFSESICGNSQVSFGDPLLHLKSIVTLTSSTSTQCDPPPRQRDHTRLFKHLIDALIVHSAPVHGNCRNAFWNPNLNAHHPKRVHCREQVDSRLLLRFAQAPSRVSAAAAQQQICDSRVTTHSSRNVTPMELVAVSNKQAASHAEGEPMDARVCEYTLREVSKCSAGIPPACTAAAAAFAQINSATHSDLREASAVNSS